MAVVNFTAFRTGSITFKMNSLNFIVIILAAILIIFIVNSKLHSANLNTATAKSATTAITAEFTVKYTAITTKLTATAFEAPPILIINCFTKFF